MLDTRQERLFITDDGLKIPYYEMGNSSADTISCARAVIVLYSESGSDIDYPGFVEKLDIPECRVFLFPLNDEAIFLDRSKPALYTYRQEHIFQQFVEHVNEFYTIAVNEISVISCAKSSLLLSAWLIDYAARVSSVVLISPASFSANKLQFLSVLNHCWHKNKFRGFKDNLASTEINISKCRHAHGKKILSRNMAMRRDRIKSFQRILRDAFAYQAPTLFVYFKDESSEHDTFFRKIASVKKEIVHLEFSSSGKETTESESLFYAHIRDFILARFSESAASVSLFDEYIKGVTKKEYDTLKKDETHFFKIIYWFIVRRFMRSVGKWSDGLRVGFDNGFDSGVSLEYMYQNDPKGKYVFGKLIDRIYLNNSACRSVRVREKNVEKFILMATEKLAAEGKAINLLDIAAGCGRYVINTLEKINQPVDHVLMRDYDSVNVVAGRKLIDELQMANKMTFEQGDAFSLKDLATIPKDRTLTIVSGFYELISDNTLVLASLKGISEATEEGGFLIYTTLLWNPMAAFAARILPTQTKGEYWLLRRRTQLEIDQLVTEVGFVKMAQRIDPLGRFSVSLARKCSC